MKASKRQEESESDVESGTEEVDSRSPTEQRPTFSSNAISNVNSGEASSVPKEAMSGLSSVDIETGIHSQHFSSEPLPVQTTTLLTMKLANHFAQLKAEG